MKTFAYRLADEANPPKLWEVIKPTTGEALLLLVDPQSPEDDLYWRWVTPEAIWEVCSF